MAKVTFHNIRVAGLAAAVPETIRTLEDDVRVFGEDAAKIADSTGIKQRHVAMRLTTADLCHAAATKLLDESAIPRNSVDVLIFVSQTPDYPLPATSCCLQSRLNLSLNCAAFDVNLGCSGYVYGLWLASSMIQSRAAGRVLLLVGDTISRNCSPEDRSTALLFGDAGTATLLEYDENSGPSHFVLGTDGSGEDYLKIRAGGSREPTNESALTKCAAEAGNCRSAADLYMNGAEIFAFTLKAVPAMISDLMAVGASDIGCFDHIVFHQANRFMLKHLFKRMKLPKDKCVIEIERFGNTSSASIPLAMVSALRYKLQGSGVRVLLAGFGVGLSWAAASLECGSMIVCDIVVVPEEH